MNTQLYILPWTMAIGCLAMATEPKASEATISYHDEATHRDTIEISAETQAAAENLEAKFRHACTHGTPEEVALLLKGKANLEARDKGGNTPIMAAAMHGRHEIVLMLLQAGARVHALTNVGRTALDYAVASKDYESCRHLLEHGADPNLFCEMGFSPLQIATGQQQVALVKLLLEHGALVHDDHGNSACAIQIAKKLNHSELIELLEAKLLEQARAPLPLLNISDEDRTAYEKALFSAALHGKLQRLAQLIASGVDIDARRSWDGATPLIAACYYPQRAAIAALLSLGADIKLCDDEGNSALFIASSVGAADLRETLLRAGGKVDTINKQGQSLLHLAAKGGDNELIERLLAQGADVNSLDKAGRTPLMIASMHEDVDTIALLVAHGANIDLQDAERKTALMHAAISPQISSLYHLLELGAEPNLLDAEGLDALTHCLRSDYKQQSNIRRQIARPVDRYANCCLLLEYGALPTQQTLKTSMSHSRLRCSWLLQHFVAGGSMDNLFTQQQLDECFKAALLSNHNAEYIMFLIRRGPDLETPTTGGVNALQAVYLYGYKSTKGSAAYRRIYDEIFRYLLHHGACPDNACTSEKYDELRDILNKLTPTKQ